MTSKRVTFIDAIFNRLKSDTTWRVGVVLAVVIITLLICVSIVSLPPKRSFGCAPLNETQTAALLQAPQAKQGFGGIYYVEDQVIVIGPQAPVTDVINTVKERLNIDLKLLQDCDLGYLSQIQDISGPSPEAIPFSRETLDSLKLRLYGITTVTQVSVVPNVVREINDIGNSKEVFADPNYLTIRSAGDGQCANPNEGGGSPNEGGGSPNEGGGSPLTGIGPQAASDLFKKQWALEHIGLDPTRQNSPGAVALSTAGKDVRVGVFDTSPPFTETAIAIQKGERTLTKIIDWVSPMLTLTVVPSSSLPNIQPLSLVTNTSVLSDVSDHGLFVAGLIHEVAPSSDIVLYEVLSRYGCGRLFALVTRLNEFISQVNNDRGKLRGAVINLSLGIRTPQKTDEITTTTEVTPTILRTGTVSEELKAALDILEKYPVESLRLTTQAAYRSGIVVVAAAGNNSWRDELQYKPLAPQLPAAYPFVIGVAGTNANRQRACFSNWGDVSAPAGDGGVVTVTKITNESLVTTTISCGAKLRECKGDCPTAVIGPVLTWTLEYTSHYAYWSGTSFATPLVSGLAVLALDAGAKATAWLSPDKWVWLSPNEVAWAIKCGAATYDGVINVPITLMRCIRR